MGYKEKISLRFYICFYIYFSQSIHGWNKSRSDSNWTKMAYLIEGDRILWKESDYILMKMCVCGCLENWSEERPFLDSNGHYLPWHVLSASVVSGNAWSNLMTWAIKQMSIVNCNLVCNKYAKWMYTKNGTRRYHLIMDTFEWKWDCTF